MNALRLRIELDRLAAIPGIVDCAFVDAHTGLIWHASNNHPSSARMWEAAADYWRLYTRQRDCFATLGPLGIAAMYHTDGVLAVLACSTDPDVLLVSHGRRQGVDWIALQRQARAVGRLMKSKS